MWYLLVFQTMAMHGATSHTGWTNLGQFQNQKSCIKASEELTAISNQYNKGGWHEPKNGTARFVCIKDMA